MEVYLMYLKSAITTNFTEPVLFPKINRSIRETLGIFENIKIVPVSCQNIPCDCELCLVIKAQLNLSAKQSSLLANKIEFAVREDQSAYNKSFRTIVQTNPDFKLPDIHTTDTSSSIEYDYQKRAEAFVASEPEYTFDRVVLPESVRERIDEALNLFKYRKKVFDEWGLREIEPHPSASLSFYGFSGSGKSMAAEAIANKLGKKILRVSYADIESKYHGEGPKMIKAVFYATERDNAVLFIDEADSLLSKRLINVSSGSEQSTNSLRSQLLISLERFEGIVIFATNLVVNYDQAFLTRLVSIEFVKPDEPSRKKIWEVHLNPVGKSKLNIPLSDDVNIDELAAGYEFCGREIKKAVISACIRAAMNQQPCVRQCDLIYACEKIVEEERSLQNAEDCTESHTGKPVPEEITEVMQKMITAKTSPHST